MLNLKNIIQEGEQLLLNRTYHQFDDYDTWLGLFDVFTNSPPEKNNQILKLCYAKRIVFQRKDTYQLEPKDTIPLAKLCPDRCPVWNTPLDYGCYKNKVINAQNPETPHHSFYQPSVDHKIPKAFCKKYGGPIDYNPDQLENYVIISEAANTAKNKYFHTVDHLEQFYQGMKKTYFSK